MTDGVLDDFEETIDSIVMASFLPLSIIIIGVGHGDFSLMNILDADVNPLYSKKLGRYAERDMIQFVHFDKFKNCEDALTEEVLLEIPR